MGMLLEHLRAKPEKDYSVRTFAKMHGCLPAYLSDIEKGNRYAPNNYLDKIFEVLLRIMSHLYKKRLKLLSLT